MKKLLGKQGGYMLAIAVIIFIFILFLGNASFGTGGRRGGNR